MPAAVAYISGPDLVIDFANSNILYAKAARAGGGCIWTDNLLFKSMAKVDMVHVPYKGGAAAMNDLGIALVGAGKLAEARDAAQHADRVEPVEQRLDGLADLHVLQGRVVLTDRVQDRPAGPGPPRDPREDGSRRLQVQNVT